MKKDINQVLKELDKTIIYYSRTVRNSSIDVEDIAQEIRIRIFKAYKNYDQKYAVKTYFTRVIRNEISRIKFKNMKMLNYEFFDNEDYRFVNIKDNDDIDDRLNTKLIISNISNSLKKRPREIFNYLLKGFDIDEIAEKMNLSKSMVYAIKNAEIKLNLENIVYKYNYGQI